MSKVNLSVPNMMCQSCVDKIQSKLKESNIECNIDLRFKVVQVDEDKKELATELIRSLNYEVK